jgi:hypothetical protein
MGGWIFVFWNWCFIEWAENIPNLIPDSIPLLLKELRRQAFIRIS